MHWRLTEADFVQVLEYRCTGTSRVYRGGMSVGCVSDVIQNRATEWNRLTTTPAVKFVVGHSDVSENPQVQQQRECSRFHARSYLREPP